MPVVKLEKMCIECCKYSMFKRAGENVFIEGMHAEYLYIVIKGAFISQKTVNINHQNFWPINAGRWKSAKVERKVLFTANKICEGTYFGEKLMFNRHRYQINVCSSERNSMLIMIHR
jgi:hypothetical protein